MKLAAAFLTLLPASSLAAGGAFSYDPANPFNPESWAAVDIPDNQCGGAFQSGIDIPTHQCDEYEDYIFTVRKQKKCFVFDHIIVLTCTLSLIPLLNRLAGHLQS